MLGLENALLKYVVCARFTSVSVLDAGQVGVFHAYFDGGGGEIVKAGARMRIEEPEGRRFFPQMRYHARQDRVLDDLGKISGVIGVTIIHGRKCMAGGATCHPIPEQALGATPPNLGARLPRETFGIQVLRSAAAHGRNHQLVAPA